MTSFVSIVIPNLDEGEWLRRTVEAVDRTTASHDVEIVVVDDGSTDGSADFIRRGEGPARARLVQGGRLGSARARNLGAVESRGEYIVFIDANVVPDPGWLDPILDSLQQLDVALAGVGVRDYENAASVGYSCTFVDVRMQGGWAQPRSLEEPFEAVSVIGCCLGVRRDVFDDLGGFDTGHVRWGVEDVELGVRAWHLGYRCVTTPTAQVAHYFKHDKPRNFEVPWELYDVNVLRFAFTYFTGRRLVAVLTDAMVRPNFARSLEMAVGDVAFWQRRRELRRRFVHDEGWFFQRLGPETVDFEAQVTALAGDWQPDWLPGEQDGPQFSRDASVLAAVISGEDDERLSLILAGLKRRRTLAESLYRLSEAGFFAWLESAGAACLYDRQTTEVDDFIESLREADSMVTQRRQRCGNCNAINVGVQDKCMLCGAALPEGSDIAQWQQSLAATSQQTCQGCGTSLAEGAKFCVSCGTPVQAPAVPEALAAQTCASCGAALGENAKFCLHCGAAVGPGPQVGVCQSCGAQLSPGAKFCVSCGTPVS